jgi:hypothetical protein
MAARLDFEIDVELETGLITGHAGVPGLIEAFRQTGTAAVIDREVKWKSRRRGLSASVMVESLSAMWAAGGERTEDLDQFRQDKAVALLLGHELPVAQTARDFLVQLHAEDLPLLQQGKAPVAVETAALCGLAAANAELILDLQCRRPVTTATLDVDATVIPCDKRAAKLRLNVILYNLLSAYKRVGLPEELHTARPKRLRFLLLNTIGKVVRHARETLLRCAQEIPEPSAPRIRFALQRPALAGV